MKTLDLRLVPRAQLSLLALAPLFSVVVWTSCASPEPTAVDPEVEESFRDLARDAERTAVEQDVYYRNLKRLQIAIDGYLREVRVNGRSGSSKLESSERWIVKTVAGLEEKLIRTATTDRVEAAHLGSNLDGQRIPQHIVDKLSKNEFRSVAVAALGFSGTDNALSALVNALEDPELIEVAASALAIQKHADAPIGRLRSLILDESLSAETRAVCAWALFEVQSALVGRPRIEEVARTWRDILSQPMETYNGGILMQALRGLGLASQTLAKFQKERSPEELEQAKKDAELAASFVVHPVPRVRMAVCIALVRIGDVSQYEALLPLLSETNPNVQTWARMALGDLAGERGGEYDVQQWRRIFQLGDKGETPR